ncbi:MAG TPA: DNA-binding protein [Clostridiales bacterium]|nr:DNA-binding protein [Clostridiales bacterium]HBR07330.1 DNA-binding protein [Clostridiales bacterium]
MEYKIFGNQIVVRLDPGDELVKSVLALAEKENIRLASVTAIGASDDVTLGIFDVKTKRYGSVRYHTADYELASVCGNLSRKDGEPYLHLHAVIGNSLRGECHGGHLNAAVISATGEIFISVAEGEAGRRFCDEVGLNLLTF